MFSGLTNQFTSLVGAVKGGAGDEDVPVPNQEGAASSAATAVAADAGVAAAAVEQDAAAAAAAAGGEQAGEGEEGAKSIPKSASLVDSLFTEASGWLGSAKGWLGSASIPSMPAMPSMPSMPSMPAMPAIPSIPSIPGLRKSGAEAGAEGGAEGGAQPDATLGGAVSGDDDDKSRYISATEGADSHPASGGGTPTGDEGQIGQGKGDDVKITTKVTQQAKHFGSFLSSAISKAGSKIKETVKDNTILDSFNKEQEAFIKGQSGAGGNGMAPWIGHANEAKIKEEILGLSQDRRNFVRAPPAGVDFDFNYETAYPTAIAIMAEDKALETMRFELVPKIITEENFWRNYFYRVSLIIQAAELGTLGADGVGQASSGEDVNTKIGSNANNASNNSASSTASVAVAEQQLNEKNNKNANENSNKNKNSSNDINAENIKSNKPNNDNDADSAAAGVGIGQIASGGTAIVAQPPKISESEFVSETFQTTNEKTDLAEIRDGMRKLGIDSMTQLAQNSNDDEEQWEKDLEAELKDYEVVDEGGATTSATATSTKTTTKSSSKRKTKNDKSNGIYENPINDNNDDDELPTITNLRTRTTNSDWEEYADLIEDTDDLK